MLMLGVGMIGFAARRRNEGLAVGGASQLPSSFI
jgi:hypothetical protein